MVAAPPAPTALHKCSRIVTSDVEMELSSGKRADSISGYTDSVQN